MAPEEQMGPLIDRLVGVALALAALWIAALFAYRTLHSPMAVPRLLPTEGAPQRTDAWPALTALALPLGGPDSGAVSVAVFTDLECPACRGFHQTIEEILDEREDVRVLYVAHPLTYHRFAMAAARGAECASSVGALRRWMRVVFEKQDSLGLKSWGRYASESGIPDTAWIAECARQHEPSPRIQAGLDLGARIQMTGTPTVLLEGWLMPGVPTKAELLSGIRRVQAGLPPG
jgi:protein-disulfide isomerase